MKFLKLILIVALSLTMSGCWLTGAIPVVAKVATIVSDASAALSIIQQAVSSWFKHRPDAEAEMVANQLVANAWQALRVANAATSGSRKLSEEEYAAAFEDFRVAYGALHEFLKETGILKGNTLGAGGEYGEIPPPLALSPLD